MNKPTVDECPECECTALGDRWQLEGKLQQYCHFCGWTGNKRTPETIEVETTRRYTDVCGGGGWRFGAYDRYGHPSLASRSYSSHKTAEAAIKVELEHGLKNKHRGPYTIVLYPPSIEVTGEVFK